MLNTEIELRNLQIIVSVLKDELVNITLEIKDSFSARLSEKKKNKLYEKLRQAHKNLQAAKEAERILIEDPTYRRSEIANAIRESKYEEKEQRDEYRDRIFDFEKFRHDAIDNKIPSSYLSLIYTLVKELRAIRDAVDPFKGHKYHDKLEELEEGRLISSYAPVIDELYKKGLSTEEIIRKLDIDKDQIKIALAHFKYNEDEKELFEPQTVNDFTTRILCSDGKCIGVIGEDGCCKECGKPSYKKR